MTEAPASEARKRSRLPLIRACAMRLRRSNAMREMWERRHRQMREFLEDDSSVNAELADLPDTV